MKYARAPGASSWTSMFSEVRARGHARRARACRRRSGNCRSPRRSWAGGAAPARRFRPRVQAWLESALDDAHVLRASEGRIEGGVLRVERGPLRGCEGRVRKIGRHKRMAYLRFDEGGDGDCVLQAALNVPVKN
ncbi:MAG: hypothetical protein V8S24_01170 [Gordonibacter pamelaeae]